MSRRLGYDLSPVCRKTLMVILQEGKITRDNKSWRSASGYLISCSTIEALFDRYLVKVTMTRKTRTEFRARLTEIGERVARDLQREFIEQSNSLKGIRPLTEDTQRFIAQVTA